VSPQAAGQQKEIEMSEATAVKPKRKKDPLVLPETSGLPACPIVLGLKLFRRDGRGSQEMHRVMWPWPVPIVAGDPIGIPQVTNTGDVLLNSQSFSVMGVLHNLLDNAVLVQIEYGSGQWNVDPGAWDKQIAALEKAGFRKGAWVP
jgi:hypothetical protein